MTMNATMRRAFFVAAIIFEAKPALSFSVNTGGTSPVTQERADTGLDRRAFVKSATAAAGVLGFLPFGTKAASAAELPAVTFDEFSEILKDSAKSIQIVEFAGSKGEKAIARLVDGTAFEISGLVDSPTDPRSPLKLVATCRGYKIPTKFLALEQAVSSTTQKKKKVYMNTRVQEAAEKEKAKRERIAEDEKERLAELYRLEESEAAKAGGQ